jgi:hypothetical protein
MGTSLTTSGTTSSDVITAVVILGVALVAALGVMTVWISRRFDRIEAYLRSQQRDAENV